jgi:hypothetical protein
LSYSKAETLSGRSFNYTFKTLGFTSIKICNYGTGKGNGAKEILDAIKIKEVSVENYLTKKLYTTSLHPD